MTDEMDAPYIVVAENGDIVVYNKYPWMPVDDITSWFVAESITFYPSCTLPKS